VVFLFLFWLSWFYVSLSCHGALVLLGDCGLGVPLCHHGFGLSLNCRGFVFFVIVMVLVCFLFVMVLCSYGLMWSCVLLSCHGLVF
jgi:hypothetical protein